MGRPCQLCRSVSPSSDGVRRSALVQTNLVLYEGRYREDYTQRGSGLFVYTDLEGGGPFWPATYPRNTFNSKPQKGWSRKFDLDLILEQIPVKKVDLSKVSKTQDCLVFIDFCPDTDKVHVVGPFYPKVLLIPQILSYLASPNSTSRGICANYKNSRVATPFEWIISILYNPKIWKSRISWFLM